MKYLLLFLIVAGILPGASQTTVNYTRKNGDKVIHFESVSVSAQDELYPLGDTEQRQMNETGGFAWNGNNMLIHFLPGFQYPILQTWADGLICKDSYETIFNKTTTWAKAEIECESIGAHLGYFEDLNEAQTVLGEFELTDCRLTKGTCEGALWMGAQRVADKKDYKWLFESNEPLVPKSDFRKGDPDGGDQNCLAVFLPGYKYGDLHCVYDYAEYQNYLYRILGFVCTKKEKD